MKSTRPKSSLRVALLCGLFAFAPTLHALDSDNDGIDDALDCAPADAAIASNQRYYWDLDGDQAGSNTNFADICTVVPFPGTVLWRGDADDSDAQNHPVPVPRGARVFGLDFFDSGADGASVLSYVDELGVQALAVNLHWLLLESSPGVFDGPEFGYLELVRQVAQATGLRINLTLSVVSPYGLDVPADLAGAFYGGTLRLSDAAFINRYTALLDAVFTRLQGVELTSLQVGYGVDTMLRAAPIPELWADFGTFYQAVGDHARSLGGGQLAVGLTASAAALVDPVTAPTMELLNAHSDIISFTYAPRAPDYGVPDAETIENDLAPILARYPGRQLSIPALTLASAPATGSSLTRQAQMLSAMFAFWDDHPTELGYVGLYRLFDRSPAQVSSALAAGLVPVAPGDAARAAAWLGSVGLRRYEAPGAAKPAYDTLRTLLFDRGWDALIEAQTRPFRIAVTSFAHDQIPGQVLDPVVLDEVFVGVNAAADMVVHHFDRGVPWVEALADDFTSATPPYGANLLDTWSKLRARQPAGHALAVAVNPLGIPRELLAPYWGVGEGYYLDENFVPVPTGIIEDAEKRLLPAPFDAMALDSPEVATAYINYLKRVVDYFNPDYLVTGLEVNLLAETAPQASIDAYVALQRTVYTTLKADPAYRDVPIVLSFVAEQLVSDPVGVPLLVDGILFPERRAKHLEMLDALEPYTDVIGLSIYPIKTRLGADSMPAYFFDRLFETLAAHTSKRFVITETGFPSQPVSQFGRLITGSPEKQARYFKLLFAEAAKSQRVDFITNFAVRDVTAYMDRLRARAAAVPPLESAALVEFFNYFEFIGFYDALGNPMPALQVVLDTIAKSYTGSIGGTSTASISVSSPDGLLEVTLGIDSAGALHYAATRDGTPIVEPSPLGITIDGVDLGNGATNIQHSLPFEANSTFPTRGMHTQGSDHYLGTTVTVTRAGPGDSQLEIELRVFDDGFAYRYIIPGTGVRSITAEATAWQFPASSDMWFQPYVENFESVYFRGTVGEVGDDIGLPVTARVPGGPYVLASETGTAGYSGLSLRAELGQRRLDGRFLSDTFWSLSAGASSPWRFTIIAADLNVLANSDMLERLSPAPDPQLFPQGLDTPWIHPGKALWSWWLDDASGYSYDEQVRYIDAASAMNVDYVVVDAYWELGFPANGLDQFGRLAELVQYAHADGRDVGIWVWKNWFELIYPEPRRAFFDAIVGAGAVGVKIDNVYGEGSESAISRIVREEVLRDAAERGLMLNFHGVAKPTGFARTYPNQITQEGLAGLEANGVAWEQGSFAPAWHNATLPFTRFVLGAGDYTPVTFDPRKIGATTFTHQLATAGVFTSPLQHYADDPVILQQSTEVQDLLRDLPTTWDETLVLPQSAIGELVVMARRKGSEWWLFAMNGDEIAGRSEALDLTFLGGGSYHAALVSDQTATAFTREERPGQSTQSVLSMDLLPGGGFVARFTPESSVRTFRMGSVSLPSINNAAGWVQLFTHLATRADLLVHTFQEGVPWVEALNSSNIADYGPHLLNRAQELKFLGDSATPNHDLYLMVNPIDVLYETKAPYWAESNNMPLPPPWDTLAFDHPDVEQAFVNYLIALIDYFDPKYLAINIEANIFLAKRPQQWPAFKAFNANVYRTIKQRYPDILVFSTIQYEHMLGLHTDSAEFHELVKDFYPTALQAEVKELFRDSDVVGISTYPFMVAENPYLIGGDTVVTPDYFDPILNIADELGLPIAFEQVGYTTVPIEIEPGVVIFGDEQTQQNFIRFLFEKSVEVGAVLFGHFVAYDYGTNYGTVPTSVTWSHAGLYRLDGSRKPVMDDWDAYFNLPFQSTIPGAP